MRPGSPDTLICGNCRECFADFRELLEHKRSYCKLRFTCKCQENASSKYFHYLYMLNVGYKRAVLGQQSNISTTLRGMFMFIHEITLAESTPMRLLCAVCKECFYSPWDLMVHVQAVHMVNIYSLGADETNDRPTVTHPSTNAFVVTDENTNRSPMKTNHDQNDVNTAVQTNTNGTHNKINTHNDASSKDIALNTADQPAENDKVSDLCIQRAEKRAWNIEIANWKINNARSMSLFVIQQELSSSASADISMDNALLLSLSSTPLHADEKMKTNGDASASMTCVCSPRLEQISPTSSSTCTIVAALSIVSVIDYNPVEHYFDPTNMIPGWIRSWISHRQ